MITFKQYLIEAREDLIAQQQEQQILMAYKRKDANFKMEDLPEVKIY